MPIAPRSDAGSPVPDLRSDPTPTWSSWRKRLGDAAVRLRVAARRLDFWLGVGCALVIAFSALQILLFAFGRDQSIYATVADGILRGEMPYRDRWDFKPPGVFLVYSVAQAVFGKSMWGPRLLEVGGLLLMVALMVSVSRRLFADTRPGLLGGATAAWVHAQLEFWHSGQPETFGGYLTMLGLWLTLHRNDNPWRRWSVWLGCGAAFGAAFLFKPPLAGGALVCAVYLVQRARWLGWGRRALLPLLGVLVGGTIPVLGCITWFWAGGALDAFAWTLFEFTPGYTKLGWGGNPVAAFYYAAQMLFTRFSAIIAIGAVAAGVGAARSSTERQGLALLLGITALHLTGIALQAKFFEYHFAATLPVAALIAGLGWLKLWSHAAKRGGGGAVAFASLVVLCAYARRAATDVPEGFWTRSLERTSYALGLSQLQSQEELDRRFHFVADFNLAANRDVGVRLAELTSSDDPIFVWGFEPAIYWFSDRAPASRFIYNVPQRAQWGADYARQQLLSELGEPPPAAIVVQHNDRFRFVTGNDLDSSEALTHFPQLADLIQQHYEFVEQIEDFDLYRKKGAPR